MDDLKPVYTKTDISESGKTTQKEVVKMVKTGVKTNANNDMKIGELAKKTLGKPAE